jgi:hypothetical protein
MDRSDGLIPDLKAMADVLNRLRFAGRCQAYPGSRHSLGRSAGLAQHLLSAGANGGGEAAFDSSRGSDAASVASTAFFAQADGRYPQPS